MHSLMNRNPQQMYTHTHTHNVCWRRSVNKSLLYDQWYSGTPNNTVFHATLTRCRVHWDNSSQREVASCAGEGWCHASPLKPEYEGSVCLSGRITRGRRWWTASGLQLEPLIPPSDPPSHCWCNLMMPVTTIPPSLSLPLSPSLDQNLIAVFFVVASPRCLHPHVNELPMNNAWMWLKLQYRSNKLQLLIVSSCFRAKKKKKEKKERKREGMKCPKCTGSSFLTV